VFRDLATRATTLAESGSSRRGRIDGMNPAGPRRRIARIITRLNIGGPSIQAIGLTRDLSAAGYDTCLIHGTVATSEGDMRTLLPVGSSRTEHVTDLVRPISPLKDVRALWRIYRVLCDWKPDLVHTHMAKAGALGRLAALLYNRTVGAAHPARLVHTYHGHVFEGYFGSPRTKVFLAIERWLAKRTDALIAISPQVQTDLLHTFAVARSEQVHLVPLGFELERFLRISADTRPAARTLLDIPADSIVITTVGRLTAIKYHILFFDVAAVLTATRDRCVFLVVGDGELRASLEAYAAALGLASRVRFLGWRGDLETIYAATDVFVLTSRNEGTPVALIEAMASGVAAVSTDVGGVRDVITADGAGTLVKFGDVAALARAVDRFVESAELRAQTGVVARSAVQTRFDARRLLSDIGDLYARILEPDRPPSTIPTSIPAGQSSPPH
jgi:glycosyltransferase involved in cell wall biosynthesis